MLKILYLYPLQRNNAFHSTIIGEGMQDATGWFPVMIFMQNSTTIGDGMQSAIL